MSALPKSTGPTDAPAPSTEAAGFTDQPRATDVHAGVRDADSAASDGHREGRDVGPHRHDGGPDASEGKPDDENRHPGAADGNPGATTAEPDACIGNPEAVNDALRQAPPSRAARIELVEPSGWAEMPVGSHGHFAVMGTDIQSITIKTTATAKKATDRKPKARSAPGAEGGGDGSGGIPTKDPTNDEPPSGGDSRKPRVEFSIPPGLEDEMKTAGGIVRDQLVQEDAQARDRFVKAIRCVAKKPKWRSIAAVAYEVNSEDDKIKGTCDTLLALASDGHDDAIDRIHHFAVRLRKDPTGAVRWYDMAFDACLMTLGNHVLWRGGLIQRLLKSAFPELNWKEAAERRATRDKKAAAKAGKAAT